MFRGSWRSSINWLGLVGGSAGVAILPIGVPAHAGWAQACDLDDSKQGMLRDASDMEGFRGSLHFAQWRIPTSEVFVRVSSSPIPVGLFAQALFRALVSSNDSDPRFILSMLDASQ